MQATPATPGSNSVHSGDRTAEFRCRDLKSGFAADLTAAQCAPEAQQFPSYMPIN